jgi:hypothetical protein
MDRREFLWRSGGGLGGIALASLLNEERRAAATDSAAAAVTSAHHFPPRARRVVQLFMAGGASHIDLFDHKPALERRHGEKSDFGEAIEAFQNGLGPWMRPPWDFRPHGRCRKSLGEPVVPLGSCVDDIAFVHNMVGKTGVHSQATYLQATGFQNPGFPGMGCWVSYALGTLNANLPTFVVLPDHRGFASNGPKNWGAAFLPAQHQGTVIRPGAETPIADLFPQNAPFITPRSEKRTFELLAELNREHERQRPGDSRLDARIRSYELAARMQLAAPDALDISKEPPHILEMYGLAHGRKHFASEINPVEEADYFGRKCLVARRLLERGVRFVQVWHGAGQPWDSHAEIEKNHRKLAGQCDQPIAALLHDLGRLGLLEETLVVWGGEFGRTPTVELTSFGANDGANGRDHNSYGFSIWLAGGGVKAAHVHGATDEFGFAAAQDKVHVHDLHATLLRLLGFDHERFTYRYAGRDFRLTDVEGRVVPEIMA